MNTDGHLSVTAMVFLAVEITKETLCALGVRTCSHHRLYPKPSTTRTAIHEEATQAHSSSRPDSR